MVSPLGGSLKWGKNPKKIPSEASTCTKKNQPENEEFEDVVCCRKIIL